MKTVECEVGMTARNIETGQLGVVVKVDRDVETIGLHFGAGPDWGRVDIVTWPAQWERV